MIYFSFLFLSFFLLLFFPTFSNLPLSNFATMPTPTNRTKHNRATYIFELTPKDLGFLMQYILELAFFSTELMFSF